MSRTFFRKFFPAVPRAAGRPAFRASALRGGEFGIIRAPGAARAGNPPAHRMPTTPARRSAGGWRGCGRLGGIGLALRTAPQPGRFAPAHRRGRFSFLNISLSLGGLLRAVDLPRRGHASGASPCRRLSLFASAKLLAEGVASRKKNGRLRARPPSARAIPSATVPGRFSMSEGFHHFDIEEAKARPPIRMLKHFHRVRSYACMPKRPWHGLKTKKKRAADAALFLNRYIWRQSYASLKNFFLPT